jgi:hypothetical protein
MRIKLYGKSIFKYFKTAVSVAMQHPKLLFTPSVICGGYFEQDLKESYWYSGSVLLGIFY